MIKMPIVFIGHGTPMNAIENNEFTSNWTKIAKEIPTPKAILAVSAHWFTNGSKITDAVQPKMVYDMYGFPKELYEIVYSAPGAPELAHRIKNMISKKVEIDNSWGLDHGAWSVLVKMYPKADIPVFQLSIDKSSSPETHYNIGKELRELREEGVLILASGNVVHNLARVGFDMDGGYEWAYEFDEYIKKNIINKDYNSVINYKNAGKSAELSAGYPDHFYPLLYALGAADLTDKVQIFNEACVFGSLSMTCYLFG